VGNVFADASKSAYEAMVSASTFLPRRLGNSYTASMCVLQCSRAEII
jgi:3-hydroxy-3-methylglutaryl CoA synthase